MKKKFSQVGIYIEFNQSKIMENMSNKTDEKDYENSTKQTFANIITNELIYKLAEIKWL